MVRHHLLSQISALPPQPAFLSVVHACIGPDYPLPLIEIPALLCGEDVKPASGIGSNVRRPPGELRKPRAVVFGGAITQEQIREIKAKAKEVGVDMESVKWLAVEPKERQGMPSGEQIVKIVRELLEGAGL